MDKLEKINFRVSEGFKVKILKRCIELDMTISEYIRYLIQKDLEGKN